MVKTDHVTCTLASDWSVLRVLSVDSVTDTQMILRHERQTLHYISLVNIPTFLAFRTPRSGNMLRG